MNVKVEKLLEYLIKDCLYFFLRKGICRLNIVRVSDGTYPTGLASSEPPTALNLQIWHRPSLRQHLICRFGIIRASDSTYPTRLASSEPPTALNLQIWHHPSLRRHLICRLAVIRAAYPEQSYRPPTQWRRLRLRCTRFRSYPSQYKALSSAPAGFRQNLTYSGAIPTPP